MKTYTAIPTRQYADTPQREPVTIQAENMERARMKVINTMDMSYIWHVVEGDERI